MSLNKIMLIGNVGADPEIKVFGDGGKKISFRLATSKRYTDRYNQQVEETQWHTCVPLSDRLKEIVEQYVRKGSELYVEGEMFYRTVDGENGKRVYPEVRVFDMKFIGKREAGSPAQPQVQTAPVRPHASRPAAPAPVQQSIPMPEEDMPDFMKF